MPPFVLVFSDVKSTYGAVGHAYIWATFLPHLYPALLSPIHNMFFDVWIEVVV